mgnify:CR=1 FL=1
MNCPYCQQEMAAGYLQSSRMLVWDRKLLSDAITPAYGSDGMILTKRFHLSKAFAINAYYCEKCKLFLSPLDE